MYNKKQLNNSDFETSFTQNHHITHTLTPNHHSTPSPSTFYLLPCPIPKLLCDLLPAPCFHFLSRVLHKQLLQSRLFLQRPQLIKCRRLGRVSPLATDHTGCGIATGIVGSVGVWVGGGGKGGRGIGAGTYMVNGRTGGFILSRSVFLVRRFVCQTVKPHMTLDVYQLVSFIQPKMF